MRHASFVAVLTAAALSATLLAQDPPKATPPAPAAAAPTSNAAEVLGRALRFTQSLPALHYKAKGTFIMPELPEEMAGQIEFGDMEMPTLELEVMVAMPNRFVLRAGGGGMGNVACDGKQLLQSNEQFDLHSLTAAPKDLLQFLGKKQFIVGVPGASNLRMLLAPSGDKKALLDAKTVELVGEEKVGKHDAFHLVVKDEAVACDLWVMKGDEPWVLRHKPKAPKLDLSRLMGGEDEEGEGEEGEEGAEGAMTINLEPAVDLEMVEFGKELPKDAFVVQEPEGSTKVDDLEKAVMERFQEEAGEMEPEDMDAAVDEAAEAKPAKQHASVGKPAPDVELTLLDGSKQKLADLKGKVVVLDFWATWCGPCVQGLPKVTEVTKKLADQGVVFHAVNLGEDKATIETFLAKKKLAVSVAMADEALGQKFGVNGIPHTVVIGADGLVKKVHVGFGPGSEKRLEKDILEALGKPGEQKDEQGGEKKEPPKDEKKQDAGGK